MADISSPDDFENIDLGDSYADKDKPSSVNAKIASDHFSERAKEINTAKICLGIALIALSVFIGAFLIFFQEIFNHIFDFSAYCDPCINIEGKSAKNTPENTPDFLDEKLSVNFFIAVYLTTKFVLFAFLVSAFAWLTKIFSQLRRLEITYRDKKIITETYRHIFADEDAPIAKEEALKVIFEPALLLSERSCHPSSNDEFSKSIEILEKITKISESLPKKSD